MVIQGWWWWWRYRGGGGVELIVMLMIVGLCWDGCGDAGGGMILGKWCR